jgi:hypothetical protein
VRLWETFTGQECCRFVGHQEWVGAVAFSPNGKVLASANGDGTVLIWNVWHGQVQNERKTPARPDMATSWRDLASQETAVAYQAMSQLISQPDETVYFLKKRLRLASKPTAADISRWIARLEQGSYAEREKATEELNRLGALVEATLGEVLAGKPSLELRRRAENLLARPSTLDNDPEQMRARRAVVVLEYIGTREALQVLQSLSDGVAAARLTCDARAAVDRLSKLQPKP